MFADIVIVSKFGANVSREGGVTSMPIFSLKD